MAKKTEAQRERERREEFDLPAPEAQPVEGSAQIQLQHRQAKHRAVARVQAELEEAQATGKHVPGLRAKIGVGRMATSIKSRGRS